MNKNHHWIPVSLPIRPFFGGSLGSIVSGSKQFRAVQSTRLLSFLFHYRATRCVRVNLENWDLTPSNAAPFEIRFLSLDELKAQAKQIGVDLEGIEHARTAEVAPFGAGKGASVVSCLRISPHPPGLRDDFAMEFDDRLFFSTNPSPYPNSERMA